MAGVVIDLPEWRNPTTVQGAPGNTNWTQLTGYPPNNTNMSGCFLTTVTSAGVAGSGCWLSFNNTTAPANNLAAWFLQANGQVLRLGGGQSNVWFRLIAAGDILLCMFEGG